MATFPAYLVPTISGFSVNPERVVVRTEMSDGLIKQSKTRTRALSTRAVTYWAKSLTDFQNWVIFFRDSINSGADWFTWTDPIDGVSKTARIVDGAYKARPLNGLKTDWHIDLKIETWDE